jgi:cell wall-associated NlpC family hydrolase
MKLDLDDPKVVLLLRAWGTPYSWGAGQARDVVTLHGAAPPPKGLKGGRGWDCSGFAQAALALLGLLDPKAIDHTAASLWSITKPILLADARLGDLAFYGANGHITHVMVCLGDGACLGASGGGSATNGDNPRAFVDAKPIGYRSDLRGVRRLGP